MNPATRGGSGATRLSPNRLALALGLRRMHRVTVPRARATREVVVRTGADRQGRMVYGGGQGG